VSRSTRSAVAVFGMPRRYDLPPKIVLRPVGFTQVC
jgi:hypothetical protein